MISYSGKKNAERIADFPKTFADALPRQLSSFDDCWLKFGCCGASKHGATMFYARGRPTLRLGPFLARLRCSKCGGPVLWAVLDDSPYYRPGVAGSRRIVLVGEPPDSA